MTRGNVPSKAKVPMSRAAVAPLLARRRRSARAVLRKAPPPSPALPPLLAAPPAERGGAVGVAAAPSPPFFASAPPLVGFAASPRVLRARVGCGFASCLASLGAWLLVGAARKARPARRRPAAAAPVGAAAAQNVSLRLRASLLRSRASAAPRVPVAPVARPRPSGCCASLRQRSPSVLAARPALLPAALRARGASACGASSAVAPWARALSLAPTRAVPPRLGFFPARCALGGSAAGRSAAASPAVAAAMRRPAVRGGARGRLPPWGAPPETGGVLGALRPTAREFGFSPPAGGDSVASVCAPFFGCTRHAVSLRAGRGARQWRAQGNKGLCLGRVSRSLLFT